MRYKQLTGLIMILGSLTILGFWELWGRENIAYEKIIVMKEDTYKNTVITEDMLEIAKVDKALKGSLKTKDLDNILGMEAAQFIPAGTEIFSEYFQNPQLSAGGDTGRFILALPDKWLQSYPQTLRRGDEVIFYYKGELVTSAFVAYVKDDTGQEVTSPDEQRLQSSSEVSQVEVVVDQEKALILGRIGDKGGKFVLLYR